MRLRRMLVVAAAFAAVGAGPAASAGPECVSYKVVTPQTGTLQGKPCPVVLGDPFTQSFNVMNCQGIPPIGFSMCVGVHLYTP